MGRGRQKAKQTKVARALKYDSGNTDFDALQAELAGVRPATSSHAETDDDHEDDLEGDYSKWIDEDDEEDED
jgi:hypothetical protein